MLDRTWPVPAPSNSPPACHSENAWHRQGSTLCQCRQCAYARMGPQQSCLRHSSLAVPWLASVREWLIPQLQQIVSRRLEYHSLRMGNSNECNWPLALRTKNVVRGRTILRSLALDRYANAQSTCCPHICHRDRGPGPRTASLAGSARKTEAAGTKLTCSQDCTTKTYR